MLLAVVGIPSLMMFMKTLRMDAREEHDLHMELRRRADFWEKGNAFARTLRDTVHIQMLEGRPLDTH